MTPTWTSLPSGRSAPTTFLPTPTASWAEATWQPASSPRRPVPTRPEGPRRSLAPRSPTEPLRQRGSSSTPARATPSRVGPTRASWTTARPTRASSTGAATWPWIPPTAWAPSRSWAPPTPPPSGRPWSPSSTSRATTATSVTTTRAPPAQRPTAACGPAPSWARSPPLRVPLWTWTATARRSCPAARARTSGSLPAGVPPTAPSTRSRTWSTWPFPRAA